MLAGITNSDNNHSKVTMQLIVHSSIDSVAQSEWNFHQQTNTPFTCFEFHQCLELSGCTGPQTGWQPMHLMFVGLGKPVALIPAYLKTHSWGEYVFDFAWAEAYERYDRPYYPKLVAAIPYTPCAGPRMLLAPGADKQQTLQDIATQMPFIAQQYGFHSWHWLFAQQQDWPTASESTPWHRRLGCQYHWYNQNYYGFDDFLASLTSRKRKTLRKERQNIRQQGIDFEWLEGHEISELDLAKFHQCYANTYHVRGRQPYLNARFFQLLVEKMPTQITLMKATQHGDSIAYAWYFKDENNLYGRYWGCLKEVPLLHFEACYYQGIDYCIAQGIQHFDAGAQGEHKLARGFIPQATHSYHWLQETGFDQAIAQFCQREAEQVNEYITWAHQQTPYRD